MDTRVGDGTCKYISKLFTHDLRGSIRSVTRSTTLIISSFVYAHERTSNVRSPSVLNFVVYLHLDV